MRNNLGSLSTILLADNIAQLVQMTTIANNGNIGRIASESGLIFPVLFLYDLQILNFSQNFQKEFTEESYL